jgi:hypothetical protein
VGVYVGARCARQGKTHGARRSHGHVRSHLTLIGEGETAPGAGIGPGFAGRARCAPRLAGRSNLDRRAIEQITMPAWR